MKHLLWAVVALLSLPMATAQVDPKPVVNQGVGLVCETTDGLGVDVPVCPVRPDVRGAPDPEPVADVQPVKPDDVRELVDEGVATVAEVAKDPSGAPSALERFAGAVGAFVSGVVDGIVGGVMAVVDGVVALVMGVVDGVVAVVDGITHVSVMAGRGIADGFDAVGDWFSSLVGGRADPEPVPSDAPVVKDLAPVDKIIDLEKVLDEVPIV